MPCNSNFYQNFRLEITLNCIQSNVTHVKGVEGVKYYVLYSVYRGLSPLQGEGYLKSLLSCGISISPPVSLRRQLLTFLPLSTTRVIAGKTHSQSPILKTKGVLRNPVILTYLWEQSCILHTLTKLPAYCNFDLKGIFNTWRTLACARW